MKVINLDIHDELEQKLQESDRRNDELLQDLRDYEGEIEDLRERIKAMEEEKKGDSDNIEKKEGSQEKRPPPRFISEEENKSISAINLRPEVFFFQFKNNIIGIWTRWNEQIR